MSRQFQLPRAAVRRAGWLAVAILMLGAFAAPAAATRDAGNNGTVKIHEGATEAEPIVRNEPHVCTFHLHFFFADPFQAGTWEIQEWAPGDKGTTVLAGTYDTTGDGEDRQPEQGVYQLPDGHYKLFWDGDTDKHDKHKVFWVECGEVVGETTTSTTTTRTSDTTTTTTNTTTTATTTTNTTTTATTDTTTTDTTTTGTTTTGTTTTGTTTGGGQAVLGETGTPAPTDAGGVGGTAGGDVSGIGGTGNVFEGQGVTLPPTDTAAAASPDPDAPRHLLLATAVLLGIVILLSPGSPVTGRGRR